MSLKKLIMAIVLGLGLGGFTLSGNALAADHGTKVAREEHDPSSEVRKAHSPAVRAVNGNQMLQWKVDVVLHDAEGVDCSVEVELCNAAGKPHLSRFGGTMKYTSHLTPDSDEYRFSGVSFQMYLNDYWFFYGSSAQDMTIKVTVRDAKSGKVLNEPKVITVKGVADVLPPAPKERTDNPTMKPKSVWMRLVMG